MTVPPEAEDPCHSNDQRASGLIDWIDDDEVLRDILDPCPSVLGGGTDEVNGVAVPIIVDAGFIVTPGPDERSGEPDGDDIDATAQPILQQAAMTTIPSTASATGENESVEDGTVYCLTEASCARVAASQNMPFRTGSFGTVTKGCFTKGDVAYFNEGTPEEMSDPDPIPPAQIRLFCTDDEVQEPLEASELRLTDDTDESLQPIEGANTPCRTEDDCRTAALAMGLRFQPVVIHPNVGCFKKGSTAYFVPGEEDDMSKVDLAGVRERLYCDFTAESETSVEGPDGSVESGNEIGDIVSEEVEFAEETGNIGSEKTEVSEETGEKAEATATAAAVASGGANFTTTIDDSSPSISEVDETEDSSPALTDNDGDGSDPFFEAELQRLENELARLELELPFPAPLPPSTVSAQVESVSGTEPVDTTPNEVSQVMFEDELKKLQNEVEKLQTKLAEDGDIDPETLIELEKLKNTLQMFENELLKGEDGKIDVQGEDQTEDEGQTSKIDAEDEDQTSTTEEPASEPAAENSPAETLDVLPEMSEHKPLIGEDQTEDEGQTSKIDAKDEDQTLTEEPASEPAAENSPAETSDVSPEMFENKPLNGEDQTEDEGQTSKIDVEDEDQTSTVESSKPAAGSSTPETVGSEAPAVESPATISVSDPTADETVDVESPTLTTTVAQEEVLSSTPTTFNVTTTAAPANEQSAITTAQTSSTAISTQVTSITTTSSALQTPAPVPQTVNDWDHADHSCLTLELKQNGNALESGSSSEMTITYDYDLRTIMPLDGETLSSFENYIASDVAMNSCFLRRHLVEHSKKLLRGNRRSTSLIVRGFSSNPVDTNLDDQYECTIPSEESTSVCTPMRGQMTVFFDVFAEVCDQDALQKVSDELESEVLFQIQEGMESDTYTEASDNIVETVYIGPRQRGTVQSTSRRLVTCSLSPNEYTDASESAIVKPPSEGNSSSNLLYIVTTVICVSVILALLLAFLAIRRSRRRKQLFSRGPEIDKNQPDSPKTQAPMIVEIPQPIDDYEQQLLPSPVKLDMRSICSDESSSASALTESHEYKERASRYGDLYGGSYGDGGMELLQNISNLSSKEDQIFDKVSSMLANGRDEADPGGKVSHIAAIGAMSKLVTEGSHDDSRVSDDLMPGFSSSPQNSYQSIDKVDSQASENFDYSMVANSNDDEEGRESPNVSPMPSIEEESVGEEK